MSVPVQTFSIIYELNKYVADRLAVTAPKITVEQITGEVKILKVFNATGSKQVMGARWNSGSLKLGDTVKIDRRGIPLGNGKITNLQVARIDTNEIKMEGEFGLQVDAKSEIAAGDTLSAFTLVEA
jgi:translation initiation factor IF-2